MLTFQILMAIILSQLRGGDWQPTTIFHSGYTEAHRHDMNR